MSTEYTVWGNLMDDSPDLDVSAGTRQVDTPEQLRSQLGTITCLCTRQTEACNADLNIPRGTSQTGESENGPGQGPRLDDAASWFWPAAGPATITGCVTAAGFVLSIASVAWTLGLMGVSLQRSPVQGRSRWIQIRSTPQARVVSARSVQHHFQSLTFVQLVDIRRRSFAGLSFRSFLVDSLCTLELYP
ncbi:hypothetical protein VTN96DRAFT_9876 [Rasamsonia emersonii]